MEKYVVRMVEENKPEIIWYYGHNYCHENYKDAYQYDTFEEALDNKEAVEQMERYRKEKGLPLVSVDVINITG